MDSSIKLFFCLSVFLFTSLLCGEINGVEGSDKNHRLYGFRPTKLFVFGDSYADTGNIKKSLSSSWKFPYGITFPGKPAGRFSDGRVATDFLGRDVAGQDQSWTSLFAIVIWWSWKWRCGYVFGAIGRCNDRVAFVKKLANEAMVANVGERGRKLNRVREERQISWSKPEHGWVKINTDGAVKGDSGLATAGGVIRDGDGTWISGFALNIGVCSAPLAELWGVYYGLCFAWERGFRQVVLEVDSHMVAEFLTKGISNSHPLSFLVRLCYGFISRDWLVRICQVYREANRLADGLANYACSLPLGLHSFDFVPECVASLLRDDFVSRATARQVLV